MTFNLMKPFQPAEPQTEIEIEFRALVTELLANGVEPSDMVDDLDGNLTSVLLQLDLKHGLCLWN